MKLYSIDNRPSSQVDVIVESKGHDIEVKFSFHNGFDLKLSERITTEDEYERKVGIWEHTCFELFLKNKHGEDYYEINLAANTMHWNAFYFSHYRSSPLTESTDIVLKKVSASKNHFAFSLKSTELISNYDIHPKAIIYGDHGEPIYLSNLRHPNTGPDFHVFSIT